MELYRAAFPGHWSLMPVKREETWFDGHSPSCKIPILSFLFGMEDVLRHVRLQ